MPKKKNDWFRQNKGKYGSYEFYARASVFQLAAIEHLTNNNPELAAKFSEAFSAYQESTVNEDEGFETKKPERGLVKLTYHGGDPEKASALYDVMEEVRDYYEKFTKNLTDSEKNYKDYYDLIFQNVNFNRDGYSFITGAYDNPIFAASPLLFGAGPFLKPRMVNGELQPVDLKKLEADLRAPDGKGFFEPYMGICKAQNKMLELEIRRQKNELYGWTPQTKKAFLEEYKNNLQDYIDNYDDLKQTVKENGHLYKKDVHLNNTSDELIGFKSSRDINFVIGEMRGQVRAIENGWDLDELPLLGQVDMILELHEQNIRTEQILIQAFQKVIDDNNKIIEDSQKELAELRKDLLKAESVSHDRHYAEAGQRSIIDQFKTENADTVREHNTYLETYRYKKNHGATDEELLNFKNENAKLLDKYEQYKAELSELSLEGLINDINKKIHDLEVKIDNAEKDNVRNRSSIETKNNIIKGMAPKSKEIADFKASIWDKKVTNLNEKREILAQVNNFINTVNVENGYTHDNDKIIDEINKKLTTGMDEVVESNDFAKKLVQFDLDIYGPKPKYHNEWEQSHVINKDVFEQNFPPLDDQQKKAIPFTDVEIAYINMAASLTANDAIKAFYQNTVGDSLTPEQLAIKNYSKWTEDLSSPSTDPNYNLGSLKDIVKAGREKGYEAMSEYAAGNKKPVVEMMHKLMFLTQKKFDTASTFGNNTPHYYNMLSTFTKMLEKDPVLYNEFAIHNAKMAENERVDFEKINQIKFVSRIYNEVENDAKRLDEFDNNRENTVDTYKRFYRNEELNTRLAELPRERERLALSAMRRDVLNTVQKSYNEYLHATPVFIDSEKRKMDALNANGNEHKAANDQYVTDMNNSELSGLFKTLGTPEGLNNLDHFIDSLVDKYGMTFKEGRNLIDGKDVSLSTKFNFECQKYMLECEQKLILDQISAEQYDDDEARDELISKYMINNHQICELERGIEDGFVRAFANKNKVYHKANYDKTKLFENHVKSYIVNMDFDGMDASEITEQLKAGKYALDDVCTDIETITDTELNIVNLDDKKFTSIEEGVLLFTNPKKFYKKGSQEFDKIIDDLVALRQKMTEAENKYRADREHVYDAQALAREEKKVLDKMDAYLARKQREKNAGNDSRMARSRVEAMKAARDKLKARSDEDIATPDRSQERLLGAKGTAHIMKHGAEKLTVTNKVTGNELLEAAIFEEKHQREEYAKNVNKFRGDATKTERLFTSVKNTLYLQTIKDALGPKKGESKVQKRIKDDLIKEKLKNGISPEADKQMDKLMSTRFGNELFATVLEEITAEGADLSQENMIVLRDQALRKCYKDAMKQENANKKADVKEILEINQSLGSKELSREYDNYMKAQEAAKGKKAANLEEQNNIVNNNNQPDGIKM